MPDPLHLQAERAAAFVRGDRATLEQVYKETVQDVGNLVRRGFTSTRDGGYRVLGVRPESEQIDVVQEVYVKAFSEKARRSYDVNQPFRPYLLRICKNLMIDRLRKKGRRNELTSDSAGVDIDAIIEQERPVEAYAEDDVDGQRLADATKSFLATVTAEARAFVQLRFEQGMSQAQVAQSLGKTRRWVRTQEEVARRGLQHHLEQCGLLDLVTGGSKETT